jgi:hypothetical protein
MSESRQRSLFAATYQLALRLPDLAASLIADRERQPEVQDVLRGSLDHLWRNILTPEDGASPPVPLDSQRKSWLLLHAGLLRGVNLALITSWRASGDSLDDLERLYPGFLEYGVALNSVVGRDASRLTTTPGEDRQAVRRVADESRALLGLGLRRGYSLGFLLDIALSAEAFGRDVEPGVAIRRALAARALADDSETAATLATNGAVFDRETSQAALEAVLRSDEARTEFESVIGAVSRERPLAVPATLGRYSEGFVCSMLAYLIAWWFAVGLAAGSAGGSPVTPASALGIWRHYSVRRWVDEQSLLWARKEAAETLAAAGDADALRWRLAGLTQCAAALGWRAVAAS